MAIVGVNKLALFYVFSWFAFLATIGFFRAFSVTFPEANHYRYAVLVFFLPSLLFWTAGISKETMMYMSLGLMASGAARILSHQRAGASLLVIGTIFGIYVRPQELLLFMGAFVAAGFFRRRAASRSLRGLRRLAFMGLQVVLLLAALSLSQQLAKHAPVFNLNQLAKNNAGQASSLHYHKGPVGYPRDVYTVLFDPLPINAHGSTQRLAAFENTVIIILILTGIRRIKALPRAAFTRPYILLCTLYSVAFPYAFAALNNLGLIDRERVLFLPFMLVLLAIPVSPKGVPKQFPVGVQRGQAQATTTGPGAGACPPLPVADGPRHGALTPGHAARQGAASCHAVSMSTSHSSNCRSARPVRCSCHRARTAAGSSNPPSASRRGSRSSSAHSRSGPANQSPTGMPKPILGRSTRSAGT